MSDENSQPAGGEATPSVEDRLGSFDFDATPAPAQAADNQEPGDDTEPTETAEAEQSEPTQPDEDNRKVRLRDGREIEISELKKAYRPEWERETREFEERQRQFQGATQQFAQQAQVLTQREQLISQALESAIVVAQNRMPKPPDRSLLETDPFAYQQQEVAHRDAMAELQQLGEKQRQLQVVTQQRQHQAFQQHIRKQHEQLVTAMPELKDPAKAAKFWEKAKSYGASVGFTAQEMAQVQDARVLMVLRDAAEMRDFRERQIKLKEKEKAAAPMPPPTTSPARRVSSAERERTAARDQLNRLRKTGSAKDGEAFLSQFD
jgi:hypothetical protein